MSVEAKEKRFVRYCPTCNREVRHTTQWMAERSSREERPCQSCAAKEKAKKYQTHLRFGDLSGERNPFFGKKHSEETRAKIAKMDRSFMKEESFRQKMSETNSGEKNPMHGRSLYDHWVAKHGEEEAKKRDAALREKRRVQMTGVRNNMYGKPSPSRSGNGWKGWYKGTYFRSVRELTMMVMFDRDGTRWRPAENIEIDYLTPLGTAGTYRPDFLVEDARLVEVKPRRLWATPTVSAKKAGAEEYCTRRGLTYELVDPKILEPADIAAMRRSGDVVFDKRYDAKFLAKYGDLA